jgi:organic radical activating enzyme
MKHEIVAPVITENKIKICEIFESIQGEGRYAGYPMLFIRTSGCTRNCWFCDTKYHKEGNAVPIENLAARINSSKLKYVCWTGGEPLLWRSQITQIVNMTSRKKHHIETNGDLLKESDFYFFNYLGISPKDREQIQRIQDMVLGYIVPEKGLDIKVVTDLKEVGIGMLCYATILMPLSVKKEKESKRIQEKVWDFCVKNNIRYGPRLHVDLWGLKTRNI